MSFVDIITELFILEWLSILIFGELDEAIWYMRFTIYLSILGGANVVIGFGLSTSKGDFSIKLRQAVVGLLSFCTLFFFVFEELSVIHMIIVLISVEIIMLFDYAKKNIALRRFHA